jgi:aromatic-L-amino-acid/L-tryptophan decarboxylase
MSDEHAAGQSPPRQSALGLDPDEFRRLGHQAVDLAADYLERMRATEVFRPMTPAERQGLLEQALPDVGTDPSAILDAVVEQVMRHPMGNGHPRWFGWVNSPPAPIGAIADLLAATLNPSCAGGDHAAIYLEHCAVRWVMELVGFPTEGSMGLLVSGGSMASLVGLAAARHKAAAADGWNDRTEGLQGGRPRMTLYLSDEGHSCMRKAAELLGLGQDSIRTIPTDDQFQMDLPALRAAVAADRATGHRPFCVAASVGTVSTGAIDPLEELADFCGPEGLWLHVDGAYGALGILAPGVSSRYAGLDRVDSMALDPHKWLSVPVECGCVLVRDGRLLRDTFSLVPPYIRTEQGRGFGGLPWFSEYGFQQTRGFRALKLWMTLQQAGRTGVAAHVTRHNALAKRLAALIDADPEFERLAPVTLSIVCFRYAPDSLRGDESRLEELNKAIMHEAQAGGEVFLTNAALHGRFALRACILHFDTNEDDVAALVEVVRRIGRKLLGGTGERT